MTIIYIKRSVTKGKTVSQGGNGKSGLSLSADESAATIIPYREFSGADRNYLVKLFSETSGGEVVVRQVDEKGQELLMIYEPVIDKSGNLIEYKLTNKKVPKKKKSEAKSNAVRVDALNELLNKSK